MKLITHAGRIVGTALDDYTGPAIAAPADFDISRMGDYRVSEDGTLALVAPALPVPPGHIPVYASEAMAALWGAAPGQTLPALSKAFMAQSQSQKAQAAPFFVAGVWRDYARQTGAVAMDAADYIRLTGDGYANDLAIWPRRSPCLA